MSKNFKKIVNFPHRLMGKVTKAIKETEPESKGGKVARVAGMGMSGLFQFLLWATKYVALDNHAIRAGEKALADMKVGKNKDGEDKKVSKFMKKYPDLSAHLMYYLMFLMVAGGIKAGAEVDKVIEERKIERIAREEERQADEAKKNTYAAYLDNMRPITPILIADLIAKEGVTIDPETGLHVPYDDSDGHALKPGEKPKGKATIGFGCTRLKDGTPVTSYTPPITNEQAYELARHHLETGETYFLMYCYDTGLDDIDINSTRLAMGLGSVIYNAGSSMIENPKDKNHRERFTELRKLYDEYGYAMPDSLVVQKFKKYPVVKTASFGRAWLEKHDEDLMADKLGEYLKQGRGLYWRRWLEAGLIKGEINAEMLLNCPVKGMYEFFKYMDESKSAFFTGRENERKVNYDTYKEFRQWLKNPVNEKGQPLKHWKKVIDYLPPEVADVCHSGLCYVGNKTLKLPTYEFEQQQNINNVAIETYVIGYDQLYADAVGSYKQGDFAAAAKKYEDMILKYPDNALIRNDLAATYNKLGRYHDAIAQARDVLNRIGDKTQYAAAQYNAGIAYENLGNLERAFKNYKLSLANGNKKVQRDITRVTEQMQKSGSKTMAFHAGTMKMRKGIHDNKTKTAMPYISQNNGGYRA